MTYFNKIDENGVYHERRPNRAYELEFAIHGLRAPFVEVSLKAGEGLVIDGSALLQHDKQISLKGWPGLGNSRWLAVNVAKDEDMAVTLSTGGPGVAGAFDLSDYGCRMVCPLRSLVANGPGVTARIYARAHDIAQSLVLLEGNGWVFLRGLGDVVEHVLAPGEQVCLRSGALAAMTATVNFDPVSFVTDDTNSITADAEFTMLTGPGSVWLQSITTGSGDGAPKRPTGRRQENRAEMVAPLAMGGRTGA